MFAKNEKKPCTQINGLSHNGTIKETNKLNFFNFLPKCGGIFDLTYRLIYMYALHVTTKLCSRRDLLDFTIQTIQYGDDFYVTKKSFKKINKCD